jgi:hypothetical protein
MWTALSSQSEKIEKCASKCTVIVGSWGTLLSGTMQQPHGIELSEYFSDNYH